MKRNFVSNSSDSVRMFRNGFLESLSKVHYYVPLIVFLPVIFFLMWQSLVVQQMAVLPLLGYTFIGLLIWTFTEYIMHRFVFHYYPTSKAGQRIHFIFHGVHHDYPNDAKRLVMPPSASIPLAAAFFGLFYLILPKNIVFACFLGFITGYLIYDMTHYALHHASFKNSFWIKLKKHHMLHHYSDATKGYGVSSDIWDKILGSNFIKK